MATLSRCAQTNCRCSGPCGVTPQSVIATVKPPFAITHLPGAMLVTDLKNRQFAMIEGHSGR
jgi:uncharacterized protein YcsI (UPF0317 family)